MHQIRLQIDEQDRIIAQHRQDFFNLNSVELVLLASAVILCLAGIMFDSPFLSDGSEPLRGTILTYASIIIIALTLLYFVLALGWEIKVSTKKRKPNARSCGP